MIPITNKILHALIKENKHSRQDSNKFSKNIVLSNYIYLFKDLSIIRIKLILNRS